MPYFEFPFFVDFACIVTGIAIDEYHFDDTAGYCTEIEKSHDSWGNNEVCQCTNSDTDQITSSPYLIDKEIELGLSAAEQKMCFVERVIALTNESVIVLSGYC